MSVRAGELLLVSYRRSRAASPEIGIARGQDIIPITHLGWPADDILQACERTQRADGHLEELANALAESRPDVLIKTGQVALCPPVANPEKIICLGLNYRDHASEAGFEPPPVPIFFSKFRNALTGPFDPIVLPRSSREVDFEGKLAVVIGKAGKYVPLEDALDHVAGYAVMNDVSARDLQLRTSQ